jgi:hypothetical protein
MTNPIVLWIAHLLGIYPGWVIVGIIFVICFGGLYLIAWLIVDFPLWVARQRRRHSGFMWYLWGVILFVSVALALILGTLITIAFWLAVLGFAGTAYRHITR